jgi:dynein heavy chain
MKRWLATLQHFKMLLLYRLIQTVSFKTIFFSFFHFKELRNLYDCPVYKTRQRGPTYVWTFNLKTKEKPAKWILAGVALLLQI